MEDNYKWIVENIRQIRKSKKMTQKEVAEKSGLSESNYSLLENGKQQPGINVLIRVANALEVEVGLFFINPDLEKTSIEEKVRQLNELPEKERSAIETMIDMAIQKNREQER